MIKRKSYELLCEERESILDEKENYKKGLTNIKLGFFINTKYTYYDELSYMLKKVDNDLIPYKILYRMKLYQEINKKITHNLVLYIASFGDFIDKFACKHLFKA